MNLEIIVYDELIRLRNKIHNADRLDLNLNPNAYMIKNLRTKIETDAVSNINPNRKVIYNE